MSFIAIPEETPGGSLANSGFWPDIDLTDARKSMRIDEMVTEERLTKALISAIAYVNDRLRPYRERLEAAGHPKIENVPAEEINGQSVKLSRYIQAVYSWATAQLIENYVTLDITNTGQKRADLQNPMIDGHRRDCYWAIQDIQALPRTVAELI